MIPTIGLQEEEKNEVIPKWMSTENINQTHDMQIVYN